MTRPISLARAEGRLLLPFRLGRERHDQHDADNYREKNHCDDEYFKEAKAKHSLIAFFRCRTMKWKWRPRMPEAHLMP